jgi:TfoX/Sxy family transcriptional regulator of competence genes
MLSAIDKKTIIKKALKWIFSGFSLFFIGTLFFIIVHDALTGASSQSTAEYCTKYGFLASPDCW